MSNRLVLLVAGLAAPCILNTGCGPKSVGPGAVPALQAYVTEAKASPPPMAPAEGSLWAPNSGTTALVRDFRARNVNDVVTIRVIESTLASASADAKNSRNSEMKAGFDSFFGVEDQIKELPSLVSGKSSSSFQGKGSTTRTSTLQTNVTARVIDVLPNGYLVVEAVREIRLNNETQHVYLTGVVRPEDISRFNVVPSSSVAQMTVRVQGRGIVSEPLNPGWLYKILNSILPF